MLEQANILKMFANGPNLKILTPETNRLISWSMYDLFAGLGGLTPGQSNGEVKILVSRRSTPVEVDNFRVWLFRPQKLLFAIDQ